MQEPATYNNLILKILYNAQRCIAVILDRYQEQPHLLDPHLGMLHKKHYFVSLGLLIVNQMK